MKITQLQDISIDLEQYAEGEGYLSLKEMIKDSIMAVDNIAWETKIIKLHKLWEEQLKLSDGVNEIVLNDLRNTVAGYVEEILENMFNSWD